jgi:pyruvate,water dikinase
MGGFWSRVARSLPPRRRRPPCPSASERFACLRTIGAANDAFLAALARWQETAERASALRLGAVAEAYEALSAPAGTMVRALIGMNAGRYAGLANRYESLDRELATEALRARPVRFGPLVVWPDDAEAGEPGVVGSKTARLARLAAAGGYEISPFFAVTTHGYQQFMEASGIQDVVDEARGAADLSDAASLSRFSERVSAAVLEAPLPAPLGAALGDAMRALAERIGGDVRVAVRSSAVVEDAASSFAGQFESVLDVPPAGVAAAYRRVVASKFRVEALRYALACGFVDENVTMPVLVMAMVVPKASGIAYSRNPASASVATITAVPGLAQAIADGRGIPDIYQVADTTPPRVEEVVPGSRPPPPRGANAEGPAEAPEAGPGEAGLALGEEETLRVARLAWSLERHFGEPQDVEWALDGAGRLYVVQCRPLRVSASTRSVALGGIPAGTRVLLRGGARASGGVAAGPVLRLADAASPGDVPDGCILVVPTTSPRLAAVMGSVAGIVAGAGSETGHMATVAREFGVPCLVGTGPSAGTLREGQIVTLDADAKMVFEGVVTERVRAAPQRTAPGRRDPIRENLLRLLERVAPLTLTDPQSPSFDVEHCATLHDVARFVHQRAMAETFAVEGLDRSERRACRRLNWPRPMEILVLDLGGAVAPGVRRTVSLDELDSLPFAALLEGMMDSRLRWAGPVGFDLRGFVSVVVRSAADDQRYGEPSYAQCSPDYVHFASRLAYHFATVEAICGSSVNENYARFLFHGGAAVAERREWRAGFLAEVLRSNGFDVRQAGDRVDALLAKQPQEELEDALVMLGRLMVASRHLDMVIESPAVATALARAFLAGDYGFENVRREVQERWPS